MKVKYRTTSTVAYTNDSLDHVFYYPKELWTLHERTYNSMIPYVGRTLGPFGSLFEEDWRKVFDIYTARGIFTKLLAQRSFALLSYLSYRHSTYNNSSKFLESVNTTLIRIIEQSINDISRYSVQNLYSDIETTIPLIQLAYEDRINPALSYANKYVYVNYFNLLQADGSLSRYTIKIRVSKSSIKLLEEMYAHPRYLYRSLNYNEIYQIYNDNDEIELTSDIIKKYSGDWAGEGLGSNNNITAYEHIADFNATTQEFKGERLISNQLSRYVSITSSQKKVSHYATIRTT